MSPRCARETDDRGDPPRPLTPRRTRGNPPPSRRISFMVAANEHQALSPRQREVLSLLCEGRPARVISADLGLSEATVRNHIRGILGRLGCHSQIEAVAKARREHLVEISPV